MKLFSVLRQVVPVIAVAVLVLLASCGGSSKKYGCPNHLKASSSIR